MIRYYKERVIQISIKTLYPQKVQKQYIIKFIAYETKNNNNSNEYNNNNNNQLISSPSNKLQIKILNENNQQIINTIFYFNFESTISQLNNFIKCQYQQQFMLYKTGDFHLDYFMQLPNRKIRQLPYKKIILILFKIRISQDNFPLKYIEIIKCIGSGGFSNVYLIRLYGEIYAMKLINKAFILNYQKQGIVQNQKTILQSCNNHPFITHIELAFETKHYLAFCMQYCNGGQLFNLLRRVKKMKQKQAKFYFLQTLSAIHYLHCKGILYRDLKPQNIILDADGHIRLADFGLSKVMNRQTTYSFCGSAQYMAPQMLQKKGHSYEIDYYCLGALLYELIVGLPPHYSRNQDELFTNIINKQVQFPEHAQMSKQLKSFLIHMLQKKVQNRYNSVQQIMNDAWLKDSKLSDVLSKKLIPPFKTPMFDYNFDDTDFETNEQVETNKIKEQKLKGQQKNLSFPNFYYESNHIKVLKNKYTQKQLNFLKQKSKDILNLKQFKPIQWKQSNNIKLKQKFKKYQQQSKQIKLITNQFDKKIKLNSHQQQKRKNYFRNSKQIDLQNKYLLKQQKLRINNNHHNNSNKNSNHESKSKYQNQFKQKYLYFNYNNSNLSKKYALNGSNRSSSNENSFKHQRSYKYLTNNSNQNSIKSTSLNKPVQIYNDKEVSYEHKIRNSKNSNNHDNIYTSKMFVPNNYHSTKRIGYLSRSPQSAQNSYKNSFSRQDRSQNQSHNSSSNSHHSKHCFRHHDIKFRDSIDKSNGINLIYKGNTDHHKSKHKAGLMVTNLKQQFNLKTKKSYQSNERLNLYYNNHNLK